MFGIGSFRSRVSDRTVMSSGPGCTAAFSFFLESGGRRHRRMLLPEMEPVSTGGKSQAPHSREVEGRGNS